MKKDTNSGSPNINRKQIIPICAFLLGLYASFSKSDSDFTEYISVGYYVGKCISEVRKKRLS